MKAVRYHEMCKKVHQSVQTLSSLYIEAGDAGLTEDLIEGFVSNFARGRDRSRLSPATADELIRELDYIPPDGHYRAFVVRANVFTPKSTESLLLRLDRERKSNMILVLFVGPEPAERVRDWFMAGRSYGVVTEPTFEKLGSWAAAKTAGRWDYHRNAGDPLTREDGFRLMAHVGFDYVAALQAAATVRTMVDRGKRTEWAAVEPLIPPNPGLGYTEALVFGRGRRDALRLSEGIPEGDTLRTLGLVRYYLRQFAKLRSIEVARMGDRTVAEESGIHVWHWRTRYKPVYATYTNDRIRLRLAATERAIQAARAGAVTGVLEVLVAEW